jgi:hypothetical protein
MGWGGLEEFGSLFAPGMRHEEEERNRLEMWRDDVGDADPPSTVDLDRGIAVIRLPKKDRPEEPEIDAPADAATESPA